MHLKRESAGMHLHPLQRKVCVTACLLYTTYMHLFLLGITRLREDRRGKYIFFFSFILLMLFVFVFQNGKQVADFVTSGITSYLSFPKIITTFFSLLFDYTTHFLPYAFCISVLASLLSALSVSVLYTYYTERNKDFSKGALSLSTIPYILTIIGIQCSACGTALFGSLLTLFGGIWISTHLPLHGLELGIVGVVLQGVALYITIQKLAYTAVC